MTHPAPIVMGNIEQYFLKQYVRPKEAVTKSSDTAKEDKKRITEFNELPAVLDAKQLATLLGISRNKIYELLNSEDFPTIRIGKRMLVTKANCLAYLERNKNNNISGGQ